MDFLQIITLALQIIHVFTRKSRSKHHDSSSSEDSIENLLYFKDCQRKKDPEPRAVPLVSIPSPPPPSPPPTPKNECPFPRMCCAMTCGSQCGAQQESSFIDRQMQPVHPIGREGFEPFQPPMKPIQPSHNVIPGQPQIRKRKKMKFPTPGNMQLPINTRRNLGSAKDLIKNMINQDPDIKDILKNLVKVTMQKMNSQQYGPGVLLSSSTTPAAIEENYDEFID